jgi:anti-anti-sigma factor
MSFEEQRSEPIGYALDSGVTVFDIPESMALGYLANTVASSENRIVFAEKLVAEIKEHLAKGGRKFVIDLSRLNHIDSAGLGIVVGCRNLIANAGGVVRAVTPKDRVQGIFDIAHITAFLPLDLDLDAALGALAQE